MSGWFDVSILIHERLCHLLCFEVEVACFFLPFYFSYYSKTFFFTPARLSPSHPLCRGQESEMCSSRVVRDTRRVPGGTVGTGGGGAQMAAQV